MEMIGVLERQRNQSLSSRVEFRGKATKGRMMNTVTTLCVFWLSAVLTLTSTTTLAFAPTGPIGYRQRQGVQSFDSVTNRMEQRLYPFIRETSARTTTTTTTTTTSLFATPPDASSMSVDDMRAELDSYGVSWKSFLEKTELVEAVEKARSEGKKAKSTEKKSTKKTTSQAKTKGADDKPADSTDKKEKSREERIQEETEKASKRKATELRKELEAMGVSTKSFFEKSEFVKAYAEAMVDGKAKSGGGGRQVFSEESAEAYDPSYRDVVMQKIDRRSLMGGMVIDVSLGR